jgi:hypothetical protein
MQSKRRLSKKSKLPAHSFGVEPLESRQLMTAVPWSPQDQAIALDQATQNYPAITGNGETVAIIDRGVDYNHPDLGGGFGPGHKVIDGYDFQDNTGDVFPYDGNAHGTGTAGQIAAAPHVVNGQLYQGVAPGVNIVALKTNGANDIKGALDWIIAHRTQYNIVAINLLDQTNANQYTFSGELQSLTDNGVFIAGPVGNYGPTPAYGWLNHQVDLVGASDLNGQLSGFTPRGAAVDLVAPGGQVNIDWYYNGEHQNVASDGSSWAGPQVVATAALIKQVNPNFTPAQILSILQDSGTPIYDSLSNRTYPQLNVNAAIGLAYQRSGLATPVVPITPITPVIPVVPITPVTPVTPVTVPTTPVIPAVRTPAPPPVVIPMQTPAHVNASTAMPFFGTPLSVNQTIAARNFDKGAAGISFYDPSLGYTGPNTYRAHTVDLYRTRSDHRTWVVGSTQAGEWLNYTIKVGTGGSYDLTTRVSSVGLGGTFHVEVDGVDATGEITVPTTGSRNNFASVIRQNVTLPAGRHVIQLMIDTVGANGSAGDFSSLRFTPSRVHGSHRHHVLHGARPAAVKSVPKHKHVHATLLVKTTNR